jgi:hypothetical protein
VPGFSEPQKLHPTVPRVGDSSEVRTRPWEVLPFASCTRITRRQYVVSALTDTS